MQNLGGGGDAELKVPHHVVRPGLPEAPRTSTDTVYAAEAGLSGGAQDSGLPEEGGGERFRRPERSEDRAGRSWAGPHHRVPAQVNGSGGP